MLDRYLATFKTRWGAVTAAAAAGPVALFAANLSPPWPSENGGAAAVLGTVATIVGLLLAFVDDGTRRTWRRRAKWALIGTFLLALAYAAAWSLAVVEVPQQIGDQTIVRRFVVALVSHPEGLSHADAIRTYGPDDAFPRIEVVIGRLTLLGSWIGMFLLLTFGFGLVQSAEARRKAPRAPEPETQ